ncbi:L-threonylcarbamoyladenylate synthase [Fibrella aquatilis]|uniref:Sua5/YciO/YrdC/YwlC family protein n=1 Tax=Fibrella aquatilis TaxID=2817059 RepID=A0A939GA96_9BACT|nr:Sua5/YciO/YrdC/YwlC family protein [Fibrella aquatilis]MBO0933180.1 Sua5/YciO/YrdC/YwlC family protein [Fibrella aquatilis]
MTTTNRELIHALRQGQLLGIADETGWSVGADPQNETALAQLLALKKATNNPCMLTVLARNTDQVAMYVLKMPDIAYDLVEFAEIPLTVVFEQGKNVAGDLANGEIAIRKSTDETVQFLLGGFTKGLITLPFESFTLPDAAQKAVAHTVGTVSRNFRKPRIMKLGQGGEVEFLRK